MSLRLVRNPHMKKRVVTIARRAAVILAGLGLGGHSSSADVRLCHWSAILFGISITQYRRV